MSIFFLGGKEKKKDQAGHFLGKKTRQESQMDHFNSLASETKSKQELRTLEMHLLKPKPIPRYQGSKSGQTTFQKRSMLFKFPDNSWVNRIGKQFVINKYMNNNTYDVSWVMEIISLLEKKRLRWSQTEKKFFMKSKTGKSIKL